VATTFRFNDGHIICGQPKNLIETQRDIYKHTLVSMPRKKCFYRNVDITSPAQVFRGTGLSYLFENKKKSFSQEYMEKWNVLKVQDFQFQKKLP
jgi:hypothetical protein